MRTLFEIGVQQPVQTKKKLEEVVKRFKTLFVLNKLIHIVKPNDTLALVCMTDSRSIQVLACIKGIESRENRLDGLMDFGYCSARVSPWVLPRRQFPVFT